MKVVVLGKYYPAYHGGMENQILQFCQSVKTDIRIEVLACNDKNESQVEEINGVTIYRKRRWREVFSTPVSPGLFSAILHSDSDLFHLHSPNPAAELALLLKKKSPFVVSYHSDVITYPWLKHIYLPLLKRILDRSRKILIASENYLRSSPLLPGFREKCVIIPYGIDVHDFSITPQVENKTNEYRKKFGERIVLFVGRFRRYKGVEYLLQAMKNVNGVMLLVGKGALERKYKGLICRFRLEKRIFFLGDLPHEDLVAAYRSASVCVLPSISRAEAFGMVLLEAMMCGRPVISTELGTATSWVNLHGKTGIVVAPRDHRALGNAINEILDDPNLADTMGQNGMSRVKESFCSRDMSRKILSVYEDVLS